MADHSEREDCGGAVHEVSCGEEESVVGTSSGVGCVRNMGSDE